MSVIELQKNDIGTILERHLRDQDGVPLDLTSTPSVYFVFKNPAGVTNSNIPGVISDAANGIVQYTIPDDFLTLEGTWEMQVRVEFSNGNIWHTRPTKFYVKENIT